MHIIRAAAALLVLSFVSNCVLAQPGVTNNVVGQPLTNFTAETGLGGIALRFALHQEHPFVFYDSTKSGNARFAGITVDLIYLLAADLKFTPVFLIDDTAPESAEKALEAIGAGATTGSPRTADVAAGAIHITYERLDSMTFSHSYYDTGYVVVVQRPPDTINIWAFFRPFSRDLWVCVIVELIIVGVLFFLMEAPFLTVQEGGDSDVTDGPPWAFIDSLYWSVSALTGTLDKAPRTWAGKIVMLAHGWFFLIIVASYTANLASVLTAASIAPSIQSWNDVTAGGKQNKIALPRGFTHADFLSFETKHHGFQFDVDYYDTYQQALQATIAGTNAASISFHDEAIVQYYLINDMQKLPNSADRCKLLTVGARFAPVGYGFAFGLDSVAFIAFSQAIIRLKEEGEVEKILLKYGVGSKAAAQIQSLCPLTSSTTELFFKDFHGLCIMTGVICGAALIVMAVSKAACDKNTPADGPADSAAVVGKGDPGMEDAVHTGVRAAMGDAAADSASPAVQAYKSGVEIGVRAGLRRLQENGGLSTPTGAPNGWSGNYQGPMTPPNGDPAYIQQTQPPVYETRSSAPMVQPGNTNNAWHVHPQGGPTLSVPPQQPPNSQYQPGYSQYHAPPAPQYGAQPPFWQT